MNRVACLGFGQMGKALLKPISQKCPEFQLIICSPNADFAQVADWPNVETTRKNIDAVKHATIIFLSIPPFALAEVLGELKDFVRSKLIISVISGVSHQQYIEYGCDRVVRLMPNTPCSVNEGCTAICPNVNVQEEDVGLVQRFLSATGTTYVIAENLIDIWSCTAGVGPAFVMMLLEAMADAMVAGGIDRQVAKEIVCQMTLGTSYQAKSDWYGSKNFQEATYVNLARSISLAIEVCRSKVTEQRATFK